jgi:hypothetical protein
MQTTLFFSNKVQQVIGHFWQSNLNPPVRGSQKHTQNHINNGGCV